MSSIYPMQKGVVTLEHKGGTKAYRIVILSNASDRAVVLFLWGKIGLLSNSQVHLCASLAEANKLADKKISEKMRGGYEVVERDSKKIEASEFLQRNVGMGNFAKLGATAIKHVDPNYDTGTMRAEPIPASWGESGEDLDRQRHAQAARDLVAEKKARERAEAEERRLKEEAERAAAYKSNPLYGMF